MVDVLVSVIIPVYNVELFLPKCLDSLLKQTYTNFEVCLVDDGSTDLSGVICDQYAKIDDRFKIIHKLNGGVSSARNLGIEIATGNYICFLDSDDWIESDYLENAARFLLKYKPVRLVNNYLYDDAEGKVVNKFADTKMLVMNSDEALYEMVKTTNFGWEPVASFYEATALKKIRFDENIQFGEDLLFNYCFIKESNGIYVYVPMAKYHYVYRDMSACNSYSISKKMDDLKVLEYIMNNEDNEIGRLLYQKEYLPRLVSRVKIGSYSNDESDLKAVRIIREKIRRLVWQILSNDSIDYILKLKCIVALLPNNIVRCFDVMIRLVRNEKVL